jgi:hypothetical protein
MSPLFAIWIQRSIIAFFSIENCSCVVDAYTRYEESYATTITNGQQTNITWLLDQALLVCVSAVLLAYGCGRVIGPIQADPPHYTDPQQIYATLLRLSADRTRPWQITSTERLFPKGNPLKV